MYSQVVHRDKNDLTDYPVVISCLPDHQYPVSDQIVLLGETSDLSVRQKQLALIISKTDVAQDLDDDLYDLTRRYSSVAKRLECSLDFAFCTQALYDDYQPKVAPSVLNDHDSVDGESNELIREFNMIISEAMKLKASDIHVEARPAATLLRLRVNGELITLREWPYAFGLHLINAVYRELNSELEVSFDPKSQQSRVINKNFNNQRIRLRITTTAAAPDGLDLVVQLTILSHSQKTELVELGFNENQIRLLTAGVMRPSGVVVIAGSAQSGKTMTARNLLIDKIQKSKNRIKAITIDAPIENYISGATQLSIEHDNAHQMDIRKISESIDLLDPDILMLDQIKSGDSLRLLASFVNAGHTAITTIQAPSAIGIIDRMAEFGIPRHILGSRDFIGCLVYQVLLPVLCPHCKVALNERSHFNHELINRVDGVINTEEKNGTAIKPIIYTRGDGCVHCHNGVNGQTAVAEVIYPDDKMLTCFAEAKSVEATSHWLNHGGRQIILHGIEKMKAGLVSPEDVEDKLGTLTSHIIFADGIIDSSEIQLLPLEITTKNTGNIISSSAGYCVNPLDEKWHAFSDEDGSDVQTLMNADVINHLIAAESKPIVPIHEKTASVSQVQAMAVEVNHDEINPESLVDESVQLKTSAYSAQVIQFAEVDPPVDLAIDPFQTVFSQISVKAESA